MWLPDRGTEPIADRCHSSGAPFPNAVHDPFLNCRDSSGDLGGSARLFDETKEKKEIGNEKEIHDKSVGV